MVVSLRAKLKEKEKQIIKSIERNGIGLEHQHKILKASRAKILSVKLNSSYRILFWRDRLGWKHLKTIPRKDLDRAAKNI